MNERAPYRIQIKRPGSLLSMVIDRDLSEAELAAIRTVLKVHDHDDESPCYCVWQFPDQCNLTMLWADAQRRAQRAGDELDGIPKRIHPSSAHPGSARWVSQQPGYLPPDPPPFRKPGEVVNGLYTVIPAGEALRREQASQPRTMHPAIECAACRIDAEQCHADLGCQHRAQGNGWCFGHNPENRLAIAQPVRPSTDSDHEMMIGHDTAD